MKALLLAVTADYGFEVSFMAHPVCFTIIAVATIGAAVVFIFLVLASL